MLNWIHCAGSALELRDGRQPVLAYMYAYRPNSDDYRPYFHVYGDKGHVLTKGVGGLYPHHRGLFLGWKRVTTPETDYDFWHCRDGAHQRHSKILEETAQAFGAMLINEVMWNDAKDRPIVVEERQTCVRLQPDGALQLDITIHLRACQGQTYLFGDRHHAGLQFRAIEQINTDASARFIRPHGFLAQREAHEDDEAAVGSYSDLGWLAMVFPVQRQVYTVQYCTEQTSVSHQFSERAYGRFGAACELLLEERHPLRLRYRLNVFRGLQKRETLAGQYAAFLDALWL